MSTTAASPAKEYLVERDGVRYVGTHLLVDLAGARNLDNVAVIEQALRECVVATDTTLLHIHLHRFTENGGITGVAVLAESHMTIHTWPEYGYAAVDVFLCGEKDATAAVPVLRRAFEPEKLTVTTHQRGHGHV